MRLLAALLLTLAVTTGMARDPDAQLSLAHSRDTGSGQATALGYRLDASRWGLGINYASGSFDQLARTADGAALTTNGRSEDLTLNLYRAFGPVELAGAVRLAGIDDGSQTQNISLGAALTGTAGRIALTIERLEIKSVIAIEQQLFQFRRVITREDERHGWGLGLDGDLLVTERWSTFAGIRRRSYEDSISLAGRIRLVTNTPLNDGQRVSDWFAYTGLAWSGRHLQLDLQIGLDEAADFEDRTRFISGSAGVPIGSQLNLVLTIGHSDSEIFNHTQFAEVQLQLAL